MTARVRAWTSDWGNSDQAGVEVAGAARVETHLGAVNPARAQSQRLEQAIQVIDCAAADQRQGAGELAFGLLQRRNEPRRGNDKVRPLRQVEQGAVDIKKKSKRPTPRAATSPVVNSMRGGAALNRPTRNS